MARALRGARERRRDVGARPRSAACRRRRAVGVPALRRRPEHVLPPGLRAVRRWTERHRRRRRHAAALRVRLPEPRRGHADRADARHARRAADLPPGVPRRRGRQPPCAVHARHRGGRARGTLASRPGRRAGARPRRRLRPGVPRALRRAARRRRQVRAHRLAVPRDARRHRPRARAGRGGGRVLPRTRPPQPARLPRQGRQPAHGALLDPRAGGGRRPAREPDRRRRTAA